MGAKVTSWRLGDRDHGRTGTVRHLYFAPIQTTRRSSKSIRRHMLANFESLPISGEYLHRDAFDVTEKYGKDTFLAI